jgi:hypothetical protein
MIDESGIGKNLERSDGGLIKVHTDICQHGLMENMRNSSQGILYSVSRIIRKNISRWN